MRIMNMLLSQTYMQLNKYKSRPQVTPFVFAVYTTLVVCVSTTQLIEYN